MLAMTLLAAGVLLGCASDDRGGESAVAVASDAEGKCSESVVQGFAPVDAASGGEIDPVDGGPATVACPSDEPSWTDVETWTETEPYIVAGAQIVAGTVWMISAMAELTLFAIQTVSLVAMIVPH